MLVIDLAEIKGLAEAHFALAREGFEFQEFILLADTPAIDLLVIIPANVVLAMRVGESVGLDLVAESGLVLAGAVLGAYTGVVELDEGGLAATDVGLLAFVVDYLPLGGLLAGDTPAAVAFTVFRAFLADARYFQVVILGWRYFRRAKAVVFVGVVVVVFCTDAQLDPQLVLQRGFLAEDPVGPALHAAHIRALRAVDRTAVIRGWADFSKVFQALACFGGYIISSQVALQTLQALKGHCRAPHLAVLA